MPDLPKAAHRTEKQKALGYINAAREALLKAMFHLANATSACEAFDHLNDMVDQTREIEAELQWNSG